MSSPEKISIYPSAPYYQQEGQGPFQEKNETSALNLFFQKYQVNVLEPTRDHGFVTRVVLRILIAVASIFTDYFKMAAQAESIAQTKTDDPNVKQTLLNKALEIAPNSLKWKYQLLLGKFFYEVGNVEEAQKCFSLIAEKNKSVGAHFVEAVSHMQQDFFQAYFSLQKAFEKETSAIGKAVIAEKQEEIFALLQQKEQTSFKEQVVLATHEALSETESAIECSKLFSSSEFFTKTEDSQIRDSLKFVFIRINERVIDNPIAQYNIGRCFDNGVGIHEDRYLATKWYRKAAEQGHSGAQNNLGIYYRNMESYAEAIKWYRKAAEQGNWRAQHNIGNYLYSERRNFREAAKWYRKAIENCENPQEEHYTRLKALLSDCYKRCHYTGRPDSSLSRDLYDQGIKWAVSFDQAIKWAVSLGEPALSNFTNL